MNKNILVIGGLVVLLLIAIVIYYSPRQETMTPQREEIRTLDQTTSIDTTESIESSFENIETNSNLDEDFISIDKELNTL